MTDDFGEFTEQELVQSAAAKGWKPASSWYGADDPPPILWRDSNGRYADAVMSAGEVAILSGSGGMGKSYVALGLAAAAVQVSDAAEYGAACGLRVRPGKVFILSYEDAPVRIGRRLRMMGVPEDDMAHVFVKPWPAALWGVDDQGQPTYGPEWATLKDGIEYLKPSFVIVDPASACADGLTNDAATVRRLMGALRELAESTGTGILLVAHDTKASRNEAKGGGDPGAGAVAGSSAWFDAARGVLYLRRDPQSFDNRILECLKANYGQTGWGATLVESRTPGGAFAGLKLAARLTPEEVGSRMKAKNGKISKISKETNPYA